MKLYIVSKVCLRHDIVVHESDITLSFHFLNSPLLLLLLLILSDCWEQKADWDAPFVYWFVPVHIILLFFYIYKVVHTHIHLNLYYLLSSSSQSDVQSPQVVVVVVAWRFDPWSQTINFPIHIISLYYILIDKGRIQNSYTENKFF